MSDVPLPPLHEALNSHWRAARDRQIAAGKEPIGIPEIADAAGTTRAAVYLWLNGQRQPRPATLEKIAEIFAKDAAEQKRIYTNLLASAEAQERRVAEAQAARERASMSPAHRPVVIDSTDIAERRERARDFWIFKWNKPFLTGDDKNLLAQLRGVIADAATGERLPRYHYVFPGKNVMKELEDLPTDGGYPVTRIADFSGLSSFQRLERLLRDECGDEICQLDKVVFKHELSHLQDVLYLGIPRAEIGYFMIEYTADGAEFYGRSVDIFVELDARTATESQDSSGANIEPQTYWLELPRDPARRLWETWQPILSQLAPEAASRSAAA